MASRGQEQTDVQDGEATNYYDKVVGLCGPLAKYASRIAIILALALSIVTVVILKKDEATLPAENEEIRSLRQKLTPCLTNGTYPIFLKRIFQLTSKIDGIKLKLTETITEMKSSLESNITLVDTSLNERLKVLQGQVSDLKTNTKKLQTNFGQYRDLTNSKFREIWQKFDEIESEIAHKRG